ncbi:MAG: FlgD immunoglobulin-like domain containing protein [Gemmatimonadota bacterium]
MVPLSLPRSRRRQAAVLGVVLGVLLGPAPGHGVKSVAVGRGAAFGWDWASAVESMSMVSVRPDSLWMWEVSATDNLVPGLASRGGQVRAALPVIDDTTGGMITELRRVAGLERLGDGDGTTALDPDQVDELERDTPIVLDLGGAFRLARVRLYPRLDRVNRHRFPQAFQVLAGSSPYGGGSALVAFGEANPNVEPVVERRFGPVDARYVTLLPDSLRAWEVAELELYGDGSAPVGEYVSKALNSGHRLTVWGAVRTDEGDVTGLPVVIHTRTGPDATPWSYYVYMGDELTEVTREVWEEAPTRSGGTPVVGETVGYYAAGYYLYRGPVEPDPAWSPWETLQDGNVRSPGLQQYLQFRVRLSEPGTVLRRLDFEYAYPPVAHDLAAEVDPPLVTGGEETAFTLSMEAHTRTAGWWAANLVSSGFRRLEVRTDAEILGIDRVRVDDVEAEHTVICTPGEGFTVNFWRRIEQEGSFVQIVFRGRVFRDGTRFEVRAVDLRAGDSEGAETVYQLAREADVDPANASTGLSVRLVREGDRLPLISGLRATPVITPNGDGVNDALTLTCALLTLVQRAPAALRVYDLRGRRVADQDLGWVGAGMQAFAWDGHDAAGRRVPPGVYVYELVVRAAEGTVRRRGTVGVAY